MKKLKGTTIIHVPAQAYSLALLLEKEADRRGVDALALAKARATDLPEEGREYYEDLMRVVCGILEAREAYEDVRFVWDADDDDDAREGDRA